MLPGPFQRFAEGRRAGLAEDWIMLSANKTRRGGCRLRHAIEKVTKALRSSACGGVSRDGVPAPTGCGLPATCAITKLRRHSPAAGAVEGSEPPELVRRQAHVVGLFPTGPGATSGLGVNVPQLKLGCGSRGMPTDLWYRCVT